MRWGEINYLLFIIIIMIIIIVIFIIIIIIIIIVIIIIIMCFRHGSIPSVLLNEDKIGRGDLWVTNWLFRVTLRRLLSRDRHVITMWLFGPIRARLTFCAYPHVSLSRSSMLNAATGRRRCSQIWIRDFATLKENQSQHSWRFFPLHIYDDPMVTR